MKVVVDTNSSYLAYSLEESLRRFWKLSSMETFLDYAASKSFRNTAKLSNG